MPAEIAVVGAGIFGVTGALALVRAGHKVTLFETAPIPAPLAESTDVSKVVRADYGDDELYTTEMERALETWRAWNAELGAALFHQTGAMFVTREPMAPGGFEHESFTLLERRGHRLERLDRRAIESRSALRGFVDGYFNAEDGWADSARVVLALAARARDLGVRVAERARVVRAAPGEVELADGTKLAADVVVVAAGGWTLGLVPEIAACFRTVGQPVFHVEAPADIALAVFGADIAQTGWYGFPARDGFVKLANHGTGRAMHPDSEERMVTPAEEENLRALLRQALPPLAEAPLKKTRVCVYCDTKDEHFWIAPHPAEPRLVVATGGSGHAFKFAPRIGEWIARAAFGDVMPRFRWRSEMRIAQGEEASRHRARDGQ